MDETNWRPDTKKGLTGNANRVYYKDMNGNANKTLQTMDLKLRLMKASCGVLIENTLDARTELEAAIAYVEANMTGRHTRSAGNLKHGGYSGGGLKGSLYTAKSLLERKIREVA